MSLYPSTRTVASFSKVSWCSISRAEMQSRLQTRSESDLARKEQLAESNSKIFRTFLRCAAAVRSHPGRPRARVTQIVLRPLLRLFPMTHCFQINGDFSELMHRVPGH